MFRWTATPTVAEFAQAIADAFAAWTSVDALTGLTTALNFVADFGTTVEGTTPGGGVNNRGAEIDLLAWNALSTGLQAETGFTTVANPATLTSGTVDYANSFSISGADISINNNPGAVYSLDVFRRLLTHEIGHAIGIGDDEGDINPGRFIDDNFDATSSATALATLTNSWALLVNPLNPALSPLQRYTVPFANPGTLTPGVNLLMESRGLGIGTTNPVTNLVPLGNDEYGTRQFLYPTLTAVPEPATLIMVGAGFIGLTRRWTARRPGRR